MRIVFLLFISLIMASPALAENVSLWGVHNQHEAIANQVCAGHNVEYNANFEVIKLFSGNWEDKSIQFRHCYEWEGVFSDAKIKNDKFVYTLHKDWLLILNASNPKRLVSKFTTPINFEKDGKPYVCSLPTKLEKLNKRNTVSKECHEYLEDGELGKVMGFYIDGLSGI